MQEWISALTHQWRAWCRVLRWILWLLLPLLGLASKQQSDFSSTLSSHSMQVLWYSWENAPDTRDCC